MSQRQSRYIPKLSDRDVIRAFEAVSKKYADRGAQVHYGDQFGQVQAEEIESLKKLGGHALVSATLRIGNESWQWTRLTAEHRDQPSAEYDNLSFSWNAQADTPDRLKTAAVWADLDAALSRPLAAIDPKAAQELASHSQLLLAMEGVAAKILEDSTQHRLELDKAYSDKEAALVKRAAEDREREIERLLEERARAEAEATARAKALDGRQQELDLLQKQLDDRNNTHVRREIRSSLLALAKERLANFSVSKETRAQYFAVHMAAIVGLLALAAGSVFYGSQIALDPKTGAYPAAAIALSIKSAALAAAAIALGSWYLGWLNRWLQRIADAEFRLQQFRLDIERASWLAETVLEWKSTSPEPFPDLLAARLSNGLFSATASEIEDPKTPATHLAEALFGAASSARVKLGNQEVSFDRKSIRELGKPERA